MSETTTSPAFVYDDGGRKAAGYKGTAGDCAVRAMSIALGLPYKDCYEELAAANKVATGKKSVRNGITKRVFNKVLQKHGWFWKQVPQFTGRKAKASDISGVCIARQAKHFVAVKDGVVQDIWDSSNKMVYGVWTSSGYREYPTYLDVDYGNKVTWLRFENRKLAEQAAKAAVHNALLDAALGYDFGFLQPGTISENDDGTFTVIAP